MQFEVISRFVTLSPPLMVELDGAQVMSRAHNLKRIGDAYQVVRPVQFKQGETIGLAAVPKALVHDLRRTTPAAILPEGGSVTFTASPPSSPSRFATKRK